VKNVGPIVIQTSHQTGQLSTPNLGPIVKWKLTNLHQKPCESKRILPQHNPPSIPQDLGNTPPDNRHRIKPRAPFDSQPQVNYQSDSEECEEYSIGGDRGPVVVDAE